MIQNVGFFYIYGLVAWFFRKIPRLSLIQHSLYVGVVEKLIPHHSQGSSKER